MLLVSENGQSWNPALLRPYTTTARSCILIQGVDNPDQAPLRPGTTVQAQIFTYLSKYAVGCYLRHCGFPRRALSESWVNRSSSKAPDFARWHHDWGGKG